MNENENKVTENTQGEAAASETAEKKPEKKKKSILAEIWEWIYTIAIALAIAFVIKGFLFDIVKVDGQSMYPTLDHKDRLIITKLGYTPDNGDIVILDSTYKDREEFYDTLAAEKGKDELGAVEKTLKYFTLPDSLKHRYYVKRVIGMPGQTVDIRDGRVYVDGQLLEEEYYNGETSAYDPGMQFPLTVEENHVFVMGDNRDHSKDSRDSSLGQVPFEAVVGKSQIRIFPFTSVGTTK